MNKSTDPEIHIERGELSWRYPQKLSEVPELLSEGYIPHGGGTTLVKTPLVKSKVKRGRGFFDLSRLKELKAFSLSGGTCTIGAGLTYAEVVTNISTFDINHILVKALSRAASNALRNRITIGGSIATFPVWSDLAGPLIALNSRLKLLDSSGKESTCGIEEYFKDRSIGRNKLILYAEVPASASVSYYYREVRTRFDYPLFTVSILPSGTGGMAKAAGGAEATGIAKAAGSVGATAATSGPVGSESTGDSAGSYIVVVTGTRGKYRKLQVASSASNLPKQPDETEKTGLQFPDRQGMSGEYLEHVARVQIRRGLEMLEKAAGQGRSK